jgi:hypothetical protein
MGTAAGVSAAAAEAAGADDDAAAGMYLKTGAGAGFNDKPMGASAWEMFCAVS